MQKKSNLPPLTIVVMRFSSLNYKPTFNFFFILDDFGGDFVNVTPR
jgi:hypothetical protein